MTEAIMLRNRLAASVSEYRKTIPTERRHTVPVCSKLVSGEPHIVSASAVGFAKLVSLTADVLCAEEGLASPICVILWLLVFLPARPFPSCSSPRAGRLLRLAITTETESDLCSGSQLQDLCQLVPQGLQDYICKMDGACITAQSQVRSKPDFNKALDHKAWLLPAQMVMWK